MELVNQNASILSCVFGPDDNYLISGDEYGGIDIWNLISGSLQARFRGHTDAISSCAISSDGALLATASYDRTVKLWNLGKALAFQPRGDRNLEAEESADGATVSSEGRGVLLKLRSGGLKLWDPSSGRTLLTIPAQAAMATECDISPDSAMILAGWADGWVRVFNSSTGETICELVPPAQLLAKNQYQSDEGNSSRFIRYCRFSSGGDHVLAATDRRVFVWDIRDGKLLIHYEIAEFTTCAIDMLRRFCVGADGNPLSVPATSVLRFWRLGSAAELVRKVPLGDEMLLINHLAVSSDGAVVAAATTAGSIILWRLEDGLRMGDLDGHEPGAFEGAFLVLSGGVSRCSFNSKGDRLVSISNGWEVKIWDVVERRCVCTMFLDVGLVDCVWLPNDGQIVLTGEGGVYVVELLGEGKRAVAAN
jgi:WD40 repeat protein